MIIASLKSTKIKIPKEIQAMLDNRNKFREIGDFEQADAIRADIESMGYVIEDSGINTVVKKK